MLLLEEPAKNLAPPPPPIDPPRDRDDRWEDDDDDDNDDDGADDDGADDDGAGGEGERVDWVTVATFGESVAAHVARLKLENEGIPVFIADENIGVALWHYSIATGGIKLQVPRELAPHAAELLGERDVPSVDQADENLQRCPDCGSTRIKFERWGGRRIGVTILLSFFAATMHPLLGLLMLVCGICFMMTTRRRRCRACGAEWREPPARGFEVVAESHEAESSRETMS